MIRRTLLGVLLALALAASARPADTSPASLLAAGRIDDALRALAPRTAASSNDAEAFHLACRAYYAVGRWDDAVRACERAVALQPGSSGYHLWLARAYGEKADHSSFITAGRLVGKVRGEFEKAVELDGSSVDARSDLAEFYIQAPGIMGGSKDKARQQAEQIATRDPAAAKWVLARIAEKDGHPDQAEALYREAIQASHGSGESWVSLASFYRRSRRYPEMEKAVQQAVTAPNLRNGVLFDAGKLLVISGRNFALASQVLRQYLSAGTPVEQAPVFQAHYLLGSILEQQGDRQGAAAEYQAALALAGDYREARTALKRLRP